MKNLLLLKGDKQLRNYQEWLNSNKQKTPNIGEDTEQQELNFLTAVGM